MNSASPSVLVGLHQLGHGELPLGDLELAPLGGHLDDAPPGDAGQDDALVERRRDELPLARGLVLEEGEHVHRADLRHLVVGAEEPQDLRAVLLGFNKVEWWNHNHYC